MTWKITRYGEDPAVSFAVEELEKYLRLMNRESMVTVIWGVEAGRARDDTLQVGLNPALKSLLPAVEDETCDDAIYIGVKNGRGVITGSNPRSVLIAVYRYLTALGCRFLRPGADGEVIPHRDSCPEEVHIAEKASYRHRSVCIEGAVSYDHVRNMIDWLPKVGMNGYFMQFFTPFTFFDRWYAHKENPLLKPEPVTPEEVSGMAKCLAREVKKRGMAYHAVGHGWTCEPFGIPGLGWDAKDIRINPETKKYFAEVNGKRELWGGIPINTNLCYSNPEVREKMTDAMAEYCAKNPEVDYLHFWLADASNNHCECENCVERPSDYYVMMLNRLDEKLTARGIKTKIVFLIYVDLLWEPVKEKLLHPERFVLMFAPITRTYSQSFGAGGGSDEVKDEPYVKNRLKMPSSVAENIMRLQRWQSVANCDSFDYDYHFMWDHFLDPGYYRMARILHEDMKNLRNIGLNGMVSCQNQRVFLPTSLGMVVMAKTLWNREADFDGIADDYFEAAFGADGGTVRSYLSTLSDLFDPVYLRGEKPEISPENASKYRKVPSVVSNFLPVVMKNLSAGHPGAVRRSWEYLVYHADYCILLANCLAYKAEGKKDLAQAAWKEVERYLCKTEKEIHNVFDIYICMETYRKVLAGK